MPNLELLLSPYNQLTLPCKLHINSTSPTVSRMPTSFEIIVHHEFKT